MSDVTPDHFEMRRLESLSNTIFGVAMTLLAYDLPRPGQFTDLPGWSDLYHLYAGRLAALVLSFVIAGLFWFSHHRRLARQPFGSRGVVMLNLLFLLSIILLPVTNGLYSNYGQSSAIAVIYGLHLTTIAALNAALWWLVLGSVRNAEFLPSAVPVLVFVPATAIASVAPGYAQYLWCLAFSAIFVRWFSSRRANAKPGEPRAR